MWRSAVQLRLGLPASGDGVPRLGGLAQLARAPALQAGGQRFESVILHVPSRGGRKGSLTCWKTTREVIKAGGRREARRRDERPACSLVDRRDKKGK